MTLRDQQRVEALNAALENIVKGLEAIPPAAGKPKKPRINIAAQRAAELAAIGYTHSNLDGSGSSGQGHTDPIGDLAARRIDTGHETRFESERKAIDTMVATITNTAAKLRRLVVAHTETVSTNQTDPECRLHAEAGRHVAVYARELCRWCYDKWLELGEDPHPELVRMHADGRRVMPAHVRHHHPNRTRVSRKPLQDKAV